MYSYETGYLDCISEINNSTDLILYIEIAISKLGYPPEVENVVK